MKSTERPVLTISTEDSNKYEVFQSEVLRPILKLQNELILGLFNNYLVINKLSSAYDDDKKIFSIIENTIKKDIVFKSTLIGAVIGHFDNDELSYYLQNVQELNKRIVAMIIERIRTQIQNLTVLKS